MMEKNFAVVCCLLLLFIAAVTSWEATTLPASLWTAVSTSATGELQYAVSDSNGVYFSNNTGLSWYRQAQLPDHDFEAVSMNDNGSVIVLAGYLDGLYVSNSSGAEFQVVDSVAKQKAWYSLAMSADGRVIYAATYNESLYWSTDYGQTFSEHPYLTYASGYFGIACDATGEIVLAALRITYPVIFSNNSGTHWYYSSSTSSKSVYTGVAVSRDGSVMVALATYEGIYVSLNAGDTWTFTRQSVALMFVACDATCQRIVVATFNSFLLQSYNQGASWQVNRNAGRRNWFGVASDRSGVHALAAVYGGNVFTGDLFPTPTAVPTISPTLRPTLSLSPSRIPTFSPTVSIPSSEIASGTSSTTRMIETVTIIVLCVIGGGSCCLLLGMRLYALHECRRCRVWLCRLVSNPYRVLTGTGDVDGDIDVAVNVDAQSGATLEDGGIVMANVEVVPTAETVQVLADDIEGNNRSSPSVSPSLSPSASVLVSTSSSRRDPSSTRSGHIIIQRANEPTVVATAVPSAAPDAIAVRAMQI